MLKVELREEDWAKLLNCAALAPYGQVQPLFAAITEQLMAQKQAQEAAKPEVDSPSATK